MGGLGSGTWTRWPTKPVVENGLTLDLYKLIKDGALRPGQSSSGSLTWSRLGEPIASIGYQSNLAQLTFGSMYLHYNHDGTPVDCSVSLTTTRPYFGGVRWWFVCPVTGAKAAKLYLPPGCDTFASRKVFHLAYRSQNEMPRDRLLTKVQDIRRKLGGRASLLDSFPDKPKGMHWQTYWRLRAKSERAEQASLMALSQRFGLVV